MGKKYGQNLIYTLRRTFQLNVKEMNKNMKRRRKKAIETMKTVFKSKRKTQRSINFGAISCNNNKTQQKKK